MLTLFIDFDFYLLATPGCNYSRNFERVAGINCEKRGAFKPGQYQPSEEDFKPGFKEKKRFLLKFFFRLSIATQLSTNLLCQF